MAKVATSIIIVFSEARAWLVYGLMRLCLISPLDFEEVKNRSYNEHNEHADIDTVAAASGDFSLLCLAKGMSDAETNRKASVDTKMSLLLGLAAMLLPLSVGYESPFPQPSPVH